VVRNLFAPPERPLVVDADGLTRWSGTNSPEERTRSGIIRRHPGEFGSQSRGVADERGQAAVENRLTFRRRENRGTRRF